MHNRNHLATSKMKLRHLAIIMDGNRRWAEANKVSYRAGYTAGINAAEKILNHSKTHEIEVITLFVFSSENWRRPQSEVSVLVSLFSEYIDKKINHLHQENVRVRFIGSRDRFPPALCRKMGRIEERTADNQKRNLILAADYGGQWDIVQAAKQVSIALAEGAVQQNNIDEQMFSSYLSLPDVPMPDLCIRTAGERRLSNFMLWQFAYTELYFTDILWPDFDESALDNAVSCYYERTRYFGGRIPC